MKRRSFLKYMGAFLVSALIPGGKWLEASAAAEAVATVVTPVPIFKVPAFVNFHPHLVTREALSILSKNIAAGAPALARSYAREEQRRHWKGTRWKT